MSRRRPPGQLPPLRNDPSQLDLFAKVRSRFANLDALSKCSWAFVGAMTLFVLNKGLAPGSAYFWMTIVQVVLLVTLVITEIIRNVRQFEIKLPFVITHIVLNLATAVVLVLILEAHFSKEARLKAEADAAAKLEAESKIALEQQQRCLAHLEQKREAAKKRKAEATRALAACREEYQRTKSLFTKDTMDERCKGGAWWKADQEYRAASAETCPGPTTGSIK